MALPAAPPPLPAAPLSSLGDSIEDLRQALTTSWQRLVALERRLGEHAALLETPDATSWGARDDGTVHPLR